jgi:hypothetical protein
MVFLFPQCSFDKNLFHTNSSLSYKLLTKTDQFMSNPKKISQILNLIEIASNNIQTARTLLSSLATESGIKVTGEIRTPGTSSTDEDSALEVVEGFFDGENMIGDNGQIYTVPPNYASKTQLVIGDRMKWILTKDREVYKLILAAPRERVTGTFAIEGEHYVVLVDAYPTPIKILKASATYAIKNLGLTQGDEVAITIPKDTTPTWGAFNTVLKGTPEETQTNTVAASTSEIDNLSELGLGDLNLDTNDYF